MNLRKYSSKVSRTLADLGSNDKNLLHMAIGISTEAAEVLDIFKKNFAYGKPIDSGKVVDEVGDIFWYCVNLLNLMGIDCETVLDKNIEKLNVRYKDGFTNEEAISRDTSAEQGVFRYDDVQHAVFITQLQMFNDSDT